MSQSVIGALRVNLGLDSANFESGARRVQNPLNAMRNSFLAVAGAAIALGTAISAAALKGAADLDKTAKAARRLGASVGGFRALELAAGEAGVSVETLADGMQTLDREVAKGGKAASEALGQLGLAAADLDNLDADEKLALIADRIKALGLTTGEASAVLQGFGIRNREMVLAVIGGGDALRKAREDLLDYGLAGERLDRMAPAIEAANDAIGRLGLIGRYAGQELALVLVPALGRMATAMTDSLREGGALRIVIDGLIGNLDILASTMAVAVTAFGVRYVGALLVAKLATFSFAGALAVLRTALIMTGIGALVVGAGVLVAMFGRLMTATGGFGGAMELLKDVAAEVWQRIVDTASLMVVNLQIKFNDIKVFWTNTVGSLLEDWNKFVDVVAGTKLGQLAGIEGGNLEKDKQATADALTALNDEFSGLINRSVELQNNLESPLSSIQALKDAMSGVKDETGEVSSAVNLLNDSLADLDPEGGGGGSKVPKLADALEDTKTISQQLGEGLAGAFAGSLAQATSLKDAAERLRQSMQRLLQSIAETLFNQAFTQIISRFLPSFGPTLQLAGARANGGPVGAGLPYLVGERGPEIVVPRNSGTVIPNSSLGKMGGSGTIVQIVNNTGQPVRQERGRAPDGREIVRTIVGEELGGGGFDRQLGGRFGVSPSTVRR